jgi:hypothetical protein
MDYSEDLSSIIGQAPRQEQVDSETEECPEHDSDANNISMLNSSQFKKSIRELNLLSEECLPVETEGYSELPKKQKANNLKTSRIKQPGALFHC